VAEEFVLISSPLVELFDSSRSSPITPFESSNKRVAGLRVRLLRSGFSSQLVFGTTNGRVFRLFLCGGVGVATTNAPVAGSTSISLVTPLETSLTDTLNALTLFAADTLSSSTIRGNASLRLVESATALDEAFP